MSSFGDYRLYRQYQPEYSAWKTERDTQNAKRLEYLKQHPELKNSQDIQRARSLLRAVDIMDEYSQKRAEDMEVATETVVGYGLDFALLVGTGLGYFLSKLKPVESVLLKLVKPILSAVKLKSVGQENAKMMAVNIAGTVLGGILATLASFPLMAWAAKTEVAASRKGRFEAMNKDLDNPNCFAVLTPEQTKEAEEKAKGIELKENKNKIKAGFLDGINTLRDMVSDSGEYKKQRAVFTKELEDRKLRINDKMAEEEITAAKRDQQLLTKIIEKIDIASQDYAENAELATQTATIGVGALGALISLGVNKLLHAINITSAKKVSAITNIVSAALFLAASIASAQIQKHASKVGRYKIKKELMEHPEELIYVDDAKASKIKDVKPEPQKRVSYFKFLVQVFKNNKEYLDYKKKQGMEEKKFFKATEELKLTPQQIKEAVTLQKNTFRTFNKIDENSQKYSESVEALGQALMTPITLIFTGISGFIAPIVAFRKGLPKTRLEFANAYAKMIGIAVLGCIPTVIMNALITKEQKKASRVADMMAIRELNDYREFRA